ncbi:tRNA glutamyl-Q(34) synthetase GluQRS [Alcanivorax sp. DP30]|uniref:tRNA glutamyl-Q(34) synthetase GluQRS n=1 Tax=Alcanivorax sp. DP30 TaxID=2606217 RepID=UPI00136EDE88|nr:tRNA glutamyl-Q(34) synthetase GluQRS [Alcanivorax sp. DP30]MZR64345.1 tRNA glutamyl-Q(34) synthetase GluQRS [Alcanivorax sp. DP30]
MTYRGRFAPTPSGPLHFGSLVAALASWLEARTAGGEWLVRVDDLDPPREVPGAADTILLQLEQFGLEWDGCVRYQSQRHDAYQAAIDQLLERRHAFYCTLTRKQLASLDHNHPGISAAVSDSHDASVRLAVPDRELCYDDGIQGRVCNNLHDDGGAFVIRRRDGLFGYQLACALDDADDGITHVLRGADLIDSTLRQRWLLECLDRPAPLYAHLPVVTDGRDAKLSKSGSSEALDAGRASALLTAALHCMGLQPPADLHGAPPATLLAWGKAHYPEHRWPPGRQQPLPSELKVKS